MENTKKSSRCSFLTQSFTPGPGAYTVPSKICEGPKITLKGRLKQKSLTAKKHPGPGQYDLPPEKIPGYVMGISKREDARPDTVKNNFPGPGTYTIPHKYLGSSWIFSPPSKKTEKFIETGPGFYNPPSTLSKRTCKFGIRRFQSQKNFQRTVPGPGTYEPMLARSNSSIIIGISKRPEIKSDIPGPGTYTIESRPNTASTLFGTGKRSDILRTIECHNSYDLPTTIGEGPKISLHPKYNTITRQTVPGPGTYNPEDMKKIPTFLFGVSKREIHKSKSLTPGPVYTVEALNEGPKWGFGICERSFNKAMIKSELPGPGSYDTKSTLKKSRITLKSRHKNLSEKHIKTIPGPGAYYQEPVKDSASWTLGKASRGLEWTKEQKLLLTGKTENKEVPNTGNPNLFRRR